MSRADNGREDGALISDLRLASAYPHAAAGVEHIETHTADVFLAGGFAYKVKKAVDFGFCDFSTLEKRRHFMARELELNLRLSSGVYLGVSEVRRDPAGRHTIDGPGETVEYALKMRRLATGDSLTALVVSGQADAGLMRQLAETIAAFHATAERAAPGSRYWSLPTVRRAVMSNLDRTDDFAREVVDDEALGSVRGYSDSWLLVHSSLIDRRHEEGRPRACHGDLHCGNVFVERDVTGRVTMQVIDCIEFNDSLRIIDPAADIAFLLMDLKVLGRPDLAEVFLDAYVDASQDIGVYALLPFYMSYRATVRCMANGLLATSAEGKRRAEATAAAGQYLDLAQKLAESELPRRLLVITSGITGVGKSTVSRYLANAWDLEWFQTDVIRKTLAGLEPTARTSGAERRNLYSRRMSRKTYAEMERMAIESLGRDRGVVMDGTFLGRQFRHRSVELGRKAGAIVLIVECVLSEEEALRRLARRSEEGVSTSEGTREVYMMQKPQWERVSDDEADAVVRIDTGQDSSQLFRHVSREAWHAALRAGQVAIQP